MASEIVKRDNLAGIGIKIEGDLGDLEIVESTDSEHSNDEKKSNVSTCIKNWDLDKNNGRVPAIIQSNLAPVLNNVSVANSENVQFGNNTYFNGPVTIKQVIKKRGVDNASYTKTDDENEATSSNYPKSTFSDKNKVERPITVPSWLKVTLTVTSVLIFGIICALTLIIRNHKDDDITNSEPSIEESNYKQVVGICYENIQIIIFTVIAMLITIVLMLYSLLTSKFFGDNKKVGNICTEPYILDYPLGDFNASTAPKPNIKADPLLIAPNHLRIVSRTDWLAQPVENDLDKIRQPVPWVIITHTATEGCYNQSQCVLRVRLIQMFHIESKQWDDIGYNFLVAGDGSAYFGRGWDYIGAHTLGYNRYSIGIAFIGTFNNEAPPQKQLEACQKLIKLGVQLGKIKKDYKLFAHRQLASTLSPGDKLYEIIKEWQNFVPENVDLTELTPKDY